MRKALGGLLLLVLLGHPFSGHPAWADQVIYKSTNKIDFVKIEKASKDQRKAGAFQHPHDFQPEEIQKVLSSLHFNKKAILAKDMKDSRLYDDDHVTFLAPYLVEAFKKAGTEDRVIVSYFTRSSKFAVPDDRLTVFESFFKEDGLHLRFNKLYAKMLGDRTTIGATRAMQEARSLRVGLEIQPGQNRVSWDPEEIVVNLALVGTASAVEEPVAEIHEKPVKSTLPVTRSEGKSIRVRMKELEQLKKDELITNEEYQKKHDELLKQL